MPRIILLPILLLLTNALFAQRDAVTIRFEPTFAGLPVELDKAYGLANGDSVVLERLRFYVSGMELPGGSVRGCWFVPGGQSGQLFAANGCGGGRQVVDHQSGTYAAGSVGDMAFAGQGCGSNNGHCTGTNGR